MIYAKETLNDLHKTYHRINLINNKLILKLNAFQNKLDNEKAREYLLEGVLRRLKILAQCIENIFTIFTPNRKNHLSEKELYNLVINLHSFFINISGILDNLGWVFVYEKDLFGKPKNGKIDRNGVGLFKKSTQQNLGEVLRTYLQSEKINNWYNNYTKNYRDSLAHRIPLYVPPAVLNTEEATEFENINTEIQSLDFTKEENTDKFEKLLEKRHSLGTVSHFFAHSMSDGGNPIYLHAQILSDYLTINEIIKKFCDDFFNSHSPNV